MRPRHWVKVYASVALNAKASGMRLWVCFPSRPPCSFSPDISASYVSYVKLNNISSANFPLLVQIKGCYQCCVYPRTQFDVACHASKYCFILLLQINFKEIIIKLHFFKVLNLCLSVWPVRLIFNYFAPVEGLAQQIIAYVVHKYDIFLKCQMDIVIQSDRTGSHCFVSPCYKDYVDLIWRVLTCRG